MKTFKNPKLNEIFERIKRKKGNDEPSRVVKAPEKKVKAKRK